MEPTLTQTFTLYGITAFDVQYWNGSAWTTVPGGSVMGNNKVWRQFSFAPITTNKIRVVVNGGADNAFSCVVEVEAWANGSSGNSSNIHWLVPDHLGTPRIILDQTGSFANLRRHDYLPFGEELPAGTGGRIAAMGYVAGDGVRQQFTSKERDIETGLDYFNARYHASMQGRFTSLDSYGGLHASPQTLNLYSYVGNNPLKYIDPTGHFAQQGNDPKRPNPNTPCSQESPCDPDANDIIKINVDQKKNEEIKQPINTLKEPGQILQDEMDKLNRMQNHEDERAVAGFTGMRQWTKFRTTLPDFSPAYVQAEVDFGGLPIPSGGAVAFTLDRNGNFYTGGGAYGGSPGFNVSAGWLLPNEPPENVEGFLLGHSVGGSVISPYWVGGGVTSASGRTSPQVMVGTPGVSGSYIYSRKRANFGPLW